mgnify:FL=1
MGFFKKLFKANYESWQVLADDIGGEYIDRGMWKSKRVIGSFENWTIVLDTFSQSSGKHSTTYTRIRAPFKSIDGLEFKVHKKNVFSKMGKVFAGKHIKTGDDEFDQTFVIKGNSEDKIIEIFSVDIIKDLLYDQVRFALEIRNTQGFF